MKTLFIIGLTLEITFKVATFWVIGSTVVSVAKVFKQECGVHYSVEPVLSGDFFCLEK